MCSILNIPDVSSSFFGQKDRKDKFGKNFEIPEMTSFLKTALEKCVNTLKPELVQLNEIIDKSLQFPIKFPINGCRVVSQPKERHSQIEFQINSVRPILHEQALWLYLDFLEYKIKYGDATEKKIYGNMSICELVQRLLEKRCVYFVGGNDTYKLLNGKCGTDLYFKPVLLDEYLSYEEVKLSAFLSVSSYTEFINKGNRVNIGKIEKDKSLIELDGIIIGIIGARFERPGEMEYQDIVIENYQNQKENGYGYKMSEISSNITENLKKKIAYRKIWNKFYDENDFEYAKSIKFFEKDKNQRLISCPPFKEKFFDTVIMKKRYAISFDTLLLEAESRAAACEKQAYIHVVGIGLGVWRYIKEQVNIFLETFGNRVELLKNQLNHIGYINFAWFSLNECNGIKNDEIFPIQNHPNGGIKFFFSNRDPHEKLDNIQFQNCLLVVSYAWDGNSLPGNEFWDGALSASGDPAAACSTLISELHNPHINQKMCNGNNLYIASVEGEIIHIADYAKKVLDKN